MLKLNAVSLGHVIENYSDYNKTNTFFFSEMSIMCYFNFVLSESCGAPLRLVAVSLTYGC